MNETKIGERVRIPFFRDYSAREYPSEIGVVENVVGEDAYVRLSPGVHSARGGWYRIATLDEVREGVEALR